MKRIKLPQSGATRAGAEIQRGQLSTLPAEQGSCNRLLSPLGAAHGYHWRSSQTSLGFAYIPTPFPYISPGFTWIFLTGLGTPWGYLGGCLPSLFSV